MSAQVDYQFIVRNVDDTADAFVVSSVPGDSLPYLTGAPSGDGSSIDPAEGKDMSGAFTGQIVDDITSGTVRAFTSQLADSNGRQQLGDRRAIWKFRDGSLSNAWQTLVYGYLTQFQLVDDLTWQVTVSDPTRAADEYTAFAPQVKPITVASPGCAAGASSIPVQALPFAIGTGVQLNFAVGRTAWTTAVAASGATSISIDTSVGKALGAPLVAGDRAMVTESIASFFARWPNRGCLFGGPVTNGLLKQPDLGGWEMQVTGRSAFTIYGSETYLSFQAGYGPADFKRKKTLDDLQGPVFNVAGDATTGHAIYDSLVSFEQLRDALFWPGLVIEIIGTGYFEASTGNIFLGLNTKNETQYQFLKNRVGGATGIFIWSSAATLAVSGQSVRVRAFYPEVCEASPIYWTGHPVDLLVKLYQEAGIPVNADTSPGSQIDITKAAVGYDRRLTLRITQTEQLGSFLEGVVLGPFGIGVRPNASGQLEVFPARIFNNAPPSLTITNDDIVQDTTTAFDLNTSTAIRKVTIQHTELILANAADQQAGLVANDGFVSRSVTVERVNGDPGAVGRKEISWTIPGMVHTEDGSPYLQGTANAAAGEIFDRYGRGLVTGKTTFLRGAAGDGVVIGQEVLVALKQLPNKNKRYGDDNTVGARAMQVVQYTPVIEGADVVLADSGPNANAVSATPTLTVAASADTPRTIAEVTVTNAATLNAANQGLLVQIAVTTGAAPSIGQYTTVQRYDAGMIPIAAFRLPAVTAGRTVYVRAAVTQVGFRPSNYSTAVSVALAALDAPTSLTATPHAGDGSQCDLAWAIGSNAGSALTDVYLRLASDPATAAVRQWTLEPGSVAYTLDGLTTGVSYTAGVQHRDLTARDVSAMVEVTFTASATGVTLTPPSFPTAFSGEQDGGPPVSLVPSPRGITFATAGRPQRDGVYGIAVVAREFPSFVEVAEAIETAVGSGTYGSFATVGNVPSQQLGYTIWQRTAPNDGLRRQLEARHARDGASPSAYTSTVVATPWITAPLRVPLSPATRTVPFEDDGYFAAQSDASGQVYLQGSGSASTQKVSVGTPTVPASMQRIYRIPYVAFVPDQGTTTNYDKQSGSLHPSTVSSFVLFAPLTLPQGSTIVELRTRCWRSGASDGVVLTLFRASDGATTGIATTTLAANATWTTVVASSLSEAVNSSFLYLLSANLSAVSGVGNAKLTYVEVVVTVPDLNTGL